MRAVAHSRSCIGTAVVTAGCESTQDKSKRLAGSGAVLSDKGLVVRRQSSDVKVLSTDVLQDENGAAAVVEMRNTSKQALVQAPVSIDVRGAGGKSLFRNDQPGLETALTHAPLLEPDERFFWVNDQVDPSSEAEIGQGKGRGLEIGQRRGGPKRLTLPAQAPK